MIFWIILKDVNDDADSNRLSSLISPAASRMLLNIVQILGKRLLNSFTTASIKYLNPLNTFPPICRCLYIYHDSREEKLFVLLRSSLGAMKNRFSTFWKNFMIFYNKNTFISAEKEGAMLFLMDRKVNYTKLLIICIFKNYWSYVSSKIIDHMCQPFPFW